MMEKANTTVFVVQDDAWELVVKFILESENERSDKRCNLALVVQNRRIWKPKCNLQERKWNNVWSELKNYKKL